MKKYIVLTSVLALAACGGGSGGHGSAPREVVKPDTDTFAHVNSDTGLGMMDINQTRAARYSQALALAQSIESESNVDSEDLFARTSSVARKSSSPKVNVPTKEEIDIAYQTMSDIVINGNITGYSKHDILVSLALVFMDKNRMMTLLNTYGGANLIENIQRLSSAFESHSDDVRDVVASARDLYRDFGHEFNLTLENAKFYHNSDDENWYTFVFDESGNLTGLREKGGELMQKKANGVFEGEHIQGYEYTFSFKGEDFEDDIELFYDTQPSESDLRADLLAAINEDWTGDAHYDEIVALLHNATLYSIGGSSNGTYTRQEEIDNAIVGRRADFTERLRIETGSKDLGLKYSDFGLRYEEMEFTRNDGLMRAYNLKGYTYSEHGGFIGGYEDRIAHPEEEMTFSGDAYAGLTRKQSDVQINNASTILEPQNNYYKGTANLIVKEKGDHSGLEQKLIADFSNAGWYKVTVDNMPMGLRGGNISFDNTKENNINAKWIADPEHQNGQIENMNIKYYGPESDTPGVNIPTESVGFVQYIENKNSDGDWTFKADITFGAKKD